MSFYKVFAHVLGLSANPVAAVCLRIPCTSSVAHEPRLQYCSLLVESLQLHSGTQHL